MTGQPAAYSARDWKVFHYGNLRLIQILAGPTFCEGQNCKLSTKNIPAHTEQRGHQLKDRLLAEDCSESVLWGCAACTPVPVHLTLEFRAAGQVNWRMCSHKDISPIIFKAVVNDSSCEAGMHHFQADLSLTSHSRVLLIQIYIWQDTLWAYIKWIRTPLRHSESISKWRRRH